MAKNSGVSTVMKTLCTTLFLVSAIMCLSECKADFLRSKRQADLEPPKQCSFHKINYTVGETWNPFLLPKGYYRCIRCSCELSTDRLTAKVDCNSQCKRLQCKNAYLPRGECCRICPGSVPSDQSPGEDRRSCIYETLPRKHGEVWAIGSKDPNLLRDDQCTECSCTNGFVTCSSRTCPSLPCRQKKPGNGTCCPVCAGMPDRPQEASGCHTMSRYYSHLENWHPRIPPTHDLCTKCTCKNTTIHCISRDCPKTTCANPVLQPGDCCYSCPADSLTEEPSISAMEHIRSLIRIRVNKPSKTTELIRNRGKNKAPLECEWGKRKFPHNSSFHPTIGSFGVEDCIRCVCYASKIDCERLSLKCPTNYSCKNPVKIPGSCCKVCKGNNSQTPPVSTLSPGRRPCSSGKYWRVFENVLINGSQQSDMSNINDQVWVQFGLEDKERDYVEIHSIEANTTHKIVKMSNTTKSDFHKFMDRAQKNNKIYRFEYIGQIREGRRIKISDREQGPCHHAHGCVYTVLNLMRILRTRGRQCRAIMSLPPETLRMLRNQNS